MRSIRDFIYYYRTCPFCKNWITLDVDLPTPTTLEIKEDKIVITLIEDKKEDNKIYSILFKNNSVDSDHPFVFKNLVNIIKRLYLPDYSESFKIEARCYSCNNFRYWSRNFIYNEKTKRLRNIGISGEKFQLHELNQSNEKISYIISNDYSKMKTKLYVLRPSVSKKAMIYDIPFMPFKNINFEDKDKLLVKIQNMLVLA